MIRFSKMFFYVTVAVLLVWQLPWCYAFLTLKPAKTPFTMYSSVLGDFVITQLMRINSFTVMIRKAIHIPNNRSTVCYLLFTYVSLRQTNVFPIPFAVGQLVRKTSS